MNVDFKGYGENVATFLADDTVKEGTLVKLSENYTVTACTTGDEIVGLCVNVRDGYAAVQLSGYVELPCSTQIALGYKGICANNGTTVKTDASAVKHCVIYSGTKTVGFIL
ncbi:MAG: hypothetical protein ACI4HO_05645 [Ruminococcus sp.]